MCLNLNQIGLLLDIVGVILLFANGLGFHFSDTFGYQLMKDNEHFKKGDDFKKIKKRYIIISRLYFLGLIFIISGFICQFFYSPVP